MASRKSPRFCVITPDDFYSLVIDEFPKKRERRAHPRRSWCTKASLKLEDQPRVVDVVTVEIAAHGCGVLARPFLHVGSRGVLYLEGVEGSPGVNCLVMSCVYHERMDHRVGLRFFPPHHSDGDDPFSWD